MTEFEAYEILLNSQPEGQRYFETISISHSKISKDYNFVIDTVDLIAGDNGDLITFTPANISPTSAQNNNDLDQTASFTIEDLTNQLDDEMDNIPLGDDEDIIIKYRIYVSDYLDNPADSAEYIVKSIAQKTGAFTLQCGAPSLNADQTGEVFSLDRFPTLRSVV